jgi:pimeloyl-ACP methyl ester carboxylesterase
LHGGPGAPVPVEKILRSPFGDALLRHFDLVYFDQRGAGRSLTGLEKKRRKVIKNKHHYQLHQYVEDLELVRKHLFGERPVTILGSSWGGFLGAAYALKHPDGVKALILGSFAATGHYVASLCGTFDRTLLRAEARHPKLRRALFQLRLAIAQSKVTWRRGTPKARLLRQSDLIDVALPLAVKARYDKLAQVLTLIAQGQPVGIKFLDQLDLDQGETASAGGSLPGEATFCQLFLDRAALRARARVPTPATYCDSSVVSGAFLKLCRPYFSRRQLFDVQKELHSIKVPTLIFAGRWDPVLEWQATQRVAQQIPKATFVLIDGGHTPVKAGGACLAQAVDAFATGKKMETSCFVASWP